MTNLEIWTIEFWRSIGCTSVIEPGPVWVSLFGVGSINQAQQWARDAPRGLPPAHRQLIRYPLFAIVQPTISISDMLHRRTGGSPVRQPAQRCHRITLKTFLLSIVALSCLKYSVCI